jgi:fructose-1,6-bisphosphatase/inositol monophosphatase family enzyme
MDDDDLLGVLHASADAVRLALDAVSDWGLADTVPGQHHSDLVADEAARAPLTAAGLGVLSEESGLHDADRDVVVVLDPLDGSSNASRGIPWYATSLCAVDPDGPRAAVVLNLPTGQLFDAVRGGGARLDGESIAPSDATRIDRSIIGLSGFPARSLGWNQYRALGASALDLCLVASGTLDGYVDCSVDAHGAWDYLGALLVCREAGAEVRDAHGRDLVVLEHAARRTPVAGATSVLLDDLLAVRASVVG